MKNHQNEKCTLDFHQTKQQQSKQKNIQNMFKCESQYQAIIFCFNKDCEKVNPFYCSQLKCQCHESHKKCQKGSITYLFDAIKEKIIDTSKLKEQVQSIIDQQINKLSQFQLKIFQLIDSKFKFIQLDKLEKKLYDFCYKEQKIKDVSSKNLAKIWQSINSQKEKKDSILQQFKANIYQLTKKLSQSLDQTLTNIKSKIKMKKLNYGRLALIQQSSIILTKNDYRRLQSYVFSQSFRRVQSLRLIFKASSYRFDLPSYYSVCGNTPKTIIICLTQNDQVFGGYSKEPIAPDQDLSSTGGQIDDHCILFSLTYGIIYHQENLGTGIKRYKNTKVGIQFNRTLFISHQANLGQTSYLSFLSNVYYPRQSARLNPMQDSYLHLVGTQHGYFKIKQWEVYKVTFEE